MPNEQLLRMAADAEQMAQSCKRLRTELRLLDINIDTQTGRFWPAHRGEIVQQMRTSHRRWQNNLLESLPRLDVIIEHCENQARLWRAEYTRLQAL